MRPSRPNGSYLFPAPCEGEIRGCGLPSPVVRFIVRTFSTLNRCVDKLGLQNIRFLEEVVVNKHRHALFVLVILFAFSQVWSQDQLAGGPAMKQRLMDLKQTVAANQAKLRGYQWTQTTQVTLKGETKKDSEDLCRYGPDGKVQKTPIGVSAPEKQLPTRGLRGRIVQKKVGEMKDYTDRLKSLISHYAPPDPQMIQAAIQADKVSLNVAGGVATITLTDYYKPGDKAAFALNTGTKKLQSYNVNTYLDDPKKDIVTLTNQFASLADGTNYVQQTVLNAEGKQLVVTTTNSGYTKVGQ
jgi:hypothetical protein